VMAQRRRNPTRLCDHVTLADHMRSYFGARRYKVQPAMIGQVLADCAGANAPYEFTGGSWVALL
jgi:hypothetical protein